MDVLIPVFLLLFTGECLYSWCRKLGWYRLNDAIANLSVGALMILTVGYFEPSEQIVAWISEHWSSRLLEQADWYIVVVAFVVLDFILYWLHWLAHKTGVLWAVHVVHHQSEEMNYSVAMRQSSFLYINSWLFLLPFAVAGFSPDVLNKVHTVSLLYQFIVHTKAISGIPLLDRVFVMPAHHRIHHARNEEYLDKNFGSVLIIWDRMFGTYAEEKPEAPIKYGVHSRLETWNPLKANLANFFELFRTAMRSVLRRRRMKTTPGDNRDITVHADCKFDPHLAPGVSLYGALQFLLCVALMVDYLFRISGGHVVNEVVHMLLLIVSFVLVPMIFDGRASWLKFESLRLLALVAIGLISMVLASESIYLSTILVLWGTVSGIYLFFHCAAQRRCLQ